jgi:hypothetical protein
MDYVFMALPLLPKRYNFVAGYNEFFRSHLKLPLYNAQAIPKKNFTPDIYTIKQINRVIKKNGNIILFPEGMSSISGANQPIVNGTGKLLKHYKIPVYYSLIQGGYLTCPKYNLDERYGHVDVTYDLLFTKEDLEKLSPPEIEDKVNEALYHDDYAWNKIHKYHFKNNGTIANDLHDLLYWCPKCGTEFKMLGEGNTIKCLHCGNGATIDDTYEMHPFNSNCVIPETQTKWFNMERDNVKREIQNPDFKLQEHVKIGFLPDDKMLKDQATSIIRGEGILTLDIKGLHFEGVKDEKPYNFNIPPKSLPTYGMCTDLSRFYTFLNGEFIEFYPDNRVVEKFFLATEEIHRLNGGAWQDFKFEK